MAEHEKIEYQDLKAGQEFPSAAFQVDTATVADYLKAVEEDNVIYRNTGLVPPMALAALALKALINTISMPPGTIHVSQEFEFIAAVNTRDTLTSQAKVSRVQERGKLHLMTVDISVVNQEQKPVLAGKTSFVLPVQ
ncbi:MAG: MaoC family dehydratase N-terminal domain-containing protein [Chloroflexota bacterium]|nr:MaoC family dehydratase N-terminal domain-containing protein [Chloroflexota bacterium]